MTRDSPKERERVPYFADGKSVWDALNAGELNFSAVSKEGRVDERLRRVFGPAPLQRQSPQRASSAARSPQRLRAVIAQTRDKAGRDRPFTTPSSVPPSAVREHLLKTEIHALEAQVQAQTARIRSLVVDSKRHATTKHTLDAVLQYHVQEFKLWQWSSKFQSKDKENATPAPVPA